LARAAEENGEISGSHSGADEYSSVMGNNTIICQKNAASFSNGQESS